MFAQAKPRAARIAAVAALLAASAVPAFTSAATGQESLDELQSRMSDIQAELDAATARIEELRDRSEALYERIDEIELRTADLERTTSRLRTQAAARADALYRSGEAGALELLMTSANFSEMAQKAEYIAQMSVHDSELFTVLARSQEELSALGEELASRQEELVATRRSLAEENDRLQEQFDDVAAEYKELKAKIAAARAARAEAAEAAPTTVADAPAPRIRTHGGMVCPVAGPVSFVDSWGAPRDGHTHQGVDMMAAYGTPLVAIVSGTITHAAYDGSGGNMIFLSGDDGNDYWYLHNQRNLVTGGHVSAGQQIATVGDTGNAAGTPHLHFEYHPGGGAAVNPYPLVASIC